MIAPKLKFIFPGLCEDAEYKIVFTENKKSQLDLDFNRRSTFTKRFLSQYFFKVLLFLRLLVLLRLFTFTTSTGLLTTSLVSVSQFRYSNYNSKSSRFFHRITTFREFNFCHCQTTKPAACSSAVSFSTTSSGSSVLT